MRLVNEVFQQVIKNEYCFNSGTNLTLVPKFKFHVFYYVDNNSYRLLLN